MLAYEPVLLLHSRDAENVPVVFQSFLEESGLWSSIGLGSAEEAEDVRLRWGNSKTAGFPRSPEREAGDIALTPPDFADNFLITVGDATFPVASKFFFLSTGAWHDPEGAQLAGADLQAGIVSAATPTVSANVPELWRNFGFRPDGDVPTPAEKRPILHRYSVDVVEYAELHSAPRLQPDRLFAGNLEELGENPIFLFYHYLFPTHEERLSTAELAALALALAREKPEASVREILEEFFTFDHQIFDTEGTDEVPPGTERARFGLDTKSYAGDMQCVCVVIPTQGSDAVGQVILPGDDAALPEPFVVGFGRRLRSLRFEVELGNGQTTRTRQFMRSSMSFEAIGKHPVVYVAGGTHNFYDSAGDDGVWPLNVGAAGFPLPTVSPDDAPPQDDGDLRKWASLTSIMKWLTLGPLAAALSTALEAGSDESEVIPGSGASTDLPGHDASDSVPLGPDDEGTVVIAPDGVMPASDNVRFWRQDVPDADRDAAELADILQADQAWWPYALDPLTNGFEGRWGVDCTDDPFDARRGVFYPNFREKMVEGLVPLIE